jgi:nickel-type superoxide dismutase maturation protease
VPIWPFTWFVVADTSMQPALRPGDRIVVNRWLAARAGDIVVVRDPDNLKRMLVKRLAERNADGSLVILADNPNVSRDSRAFGPVPKSLLVGKVVWRYPKR